MLPRSATLVRRGFNKATIASTPNNPASAINMCSVCGLRLAGAILNRERVLRVQSDALRTKRPASTPVADPVVVHHAFCAGFVVVIRGLSVLGRMPTRDDFHSWKHALNPAKRMYRLEHDSSQNSCLAAQMF